MDRPYNFFFCFFLIIVFNSKIKCSNHFNIYKLWGRKHGTAELPITLCQLTKAVGGGGGTATPGTCNFEVFFCISACPEIFFFGCIG